MPEILPRCTTIARTGGMDIRGVWHVPTYCMFCGKHHGYQPESATDPGGGYVGYVCDPCAEIPRNSDLVGVSLVPDDVHWQRVREAQFEAHGRELTLTELIRVVDDGSSQLAKLLLGR